ncbi:MAG: M55 family metallopeptidase [Longimicrobiales bacterium]
MLSHPRPGAMRARVLPLLALLFLASPAPAQQGLKVYISVDLEGAAGVVTPDQLGPAGFEYQRFREILTAEVNTAIAAAREAGATEIVVSDSHGNGENLLMERLPADIQLVRAWPRPLAMMQGIDESFDAVLLLAYHASTGNPRGVRAHTMSSASFTGIRLNGQAICEAGISAAIAGDFGVPVVMLSGDDAIAEEATALLGPIETVVTKWSYGYHSARTLMPETVNALIREKVKAALGRLGSFKPFRVEGPVTLDLSFKNYMPAEVLAYLPNVERVDSHTVRFVGKDLTEVSKFIEFVTNYRIDLAP